jgi:hypothetical protein
MVREAKAAMCTSCTTPALQPWYVEPGCQSFRSRTAEEVAHANMQKCREMGLLEIHYWGHSTGWGQTIGLA